MQIGQTITFIKSAPNYGEFKDIQTPHLVFAGRSNVGKSSLINKLCGRKQLAKVSGTPGKTRLLNLFNVDNNFLLVDLPGYGYAKVSKTMKTDWNKAIDRYLMEAADRILLIFLIDSRHEPQKKDLELLDYIHHLKLRFLVASTKIDKLSKNQLAKNLAILKNTYTASDYNRFFPVSSRTGVGVDPLVTTILNEIKSI
ncbi:MAG: YihA family ribosome biogenesis GTP-binding protein [Acidobacteria bacterium]|nr:MAG: YihA family ribosome biogenesis GTP-binding protein [Acidobacteriota bacterium]RLE24189.1 MAG: YihA family ribosome biogenesis GTP-binding protein [Acidobacteriota bacterium]